MVLPSYITECDSVAEHVRRHSETNLKYLNTLLNEIQSDENKVQQNCEKNATIDY